MHCKIKVNAFIEIFKVFFQSTFLTHTLYLVGYSCALVGDILLQGHLYVTENYLGFIPNAVAVSTVDDTQTFTSLISRDATFKAMTKSWKKAIMRNNLAVMVSTLKDKDGSG